MNRKPESTINRKASEQQRRAGHNPDSDRPEPHRTGASRSPLRFPERHESERRHWHKRPENHRDWENE